jgi:hypothetical protein
VRDTKNKTRKPVESPKNPFDAAKLIKKALSNLYGNDREMAIRWAIESTGHYAYPIKILSGNKACDAIT